MGARIAFFREYEGGQHPWLVPAVPRAVVGTVRAVDGDTATVRWARPAQGHCFDDAPEHVGKWAEPDSDVLLSAGRCLGTTDSASGTAPFGAWAHYTGPPLSEGSVIEYIVGRQLAERRDGRVLTLFQVRQLGVCADYDRWCDEAALRRAWPDQAPAALSAFERNKRPLPDP